MGLLLDFVPNHMGVARGENAYWNDVLENGPSSIHAPMFDIDWAPLEGELARKVLLPLLDAHFGRRWSAAISAPRSRAAPSSSASTARACPSIRARSR